MTATPDDSSTASRLRMIEQRLREDREVQVTNLSDLLGVSAVTVRRYLSRLEEKGIAERTHGGAVLVDPSFTQPTYLHRQATNRDAKIAIAARAASLVPQEGVIVLGGGTTTLQLMPHLINRQGLTILTANLAAAAQARPDGATVVVLGGIVRGQDCALVGEIARMALRTRYADAAIIGTDGLAADVGLTSIDEQERELVELILDHTRGPKICLADHTKVGQIKPYLAAPLQAITDLVTDTAALSGQLAHFKGQGMRVHLAEV